MRNKLRWCVCSAVFLHDLYQVVFLLFIADTFMLTMDHMTTCRDSGVTLTSGSPPLGGAMNLIVLLHFDL